MTMTRSGRRESRAHRVPKSQSRVDKVIALALKNGGADKSANAIVHEIMRDRNVNGTRGQLMTKVLKAQRQRNKTGAVVTA